jgi:hypothetical protein
MAAEQTTIPTTETPAAAAPATPVVDPAAAAAVTPPPAAAASTPKPTKPTNGKPDKALEARVNEELRRRLKMSPEEFAAFQAKGGIVIPQAAFKQRIQREAAKLQAASGNQAPAAGATPTPPNGKNAALEAALARATKAEKNAERIQRETNEQIKKAKRQAVKAEMDRITLEIQSKAARSGVNEDDLDVAVILFQRAVLADENLTPDAYFASLKTTKPVLFNAAASIEPRVVRPTTAPPEGAQRPPKPAAAGTPVVSDNAETDTPEQFKRRQERYGFVGA